MLWGGGARGTSIFVDDEFIADDDSAPVPDFEDEEPEDDGGRDECDETSRRSFDARFFHRLLEGVKRAEPRFAHRRRRGVADVAVWSKVPFRRGVQLCRAGLQMG